MSNWEVRSKQKSRKQGDTWLPASQRPESAILTSCVHPD